MCKVYKYCDGAVTPRASQGRRLQRGVAQLSRDLWSYTKQPPPAHGHCLQCSVLAPAHLHIITSSPYKAGAWREILSRSPGAEQQITIKMDL